MQIDPRLLLSKLSFGPTETDFGMLERIDGQQWLQSQLYPSASDEICDAAIRSASWPIKYTRKIPRDASLNPGETVQVDESRPVALIDKSLAQHWLGVQQNVPAAELNFFRGAVAVATVLRASLSQWQLREVLTDFWHNHFNVNAVGAPLISASLPTYDRECIRKNALGNFREMLEGVAKSPAMQLYLNNRLSRGGAPNENYARELFELHTLGQDAYLNGRYTHQRDVPGWVQGQPIGYIDEDVYEAARAFTGWTIQVDEPAGTGLRPETGAFSYVDLWHDKYQKKVLAHEFDPYQPPLADGRRVLDLVAEHPATANHVCKKLCRRLVSDDPSPQLIGAAAEVWQQSVQEPDQIARVVAFIARSEDFQSSAKSKLKRPFELIISFVRAAGIPLRVTPDFLSEFDISGQRLFGWGPPTGHPDESKYWLSSHGMLQRWRLLDGLANNAWQTGDAHALDTVASQPTTAGAIGAAHNVLTGTAPSRDLVQAASRALSMKPSAPLRQAGDTKTLARRILAWCAMTPSFQWR